MMLRDDSSIDASMSTSRKGRLAEAKAIAHLTQLGYDVFVPVGGNASCDLIIVLENEVPKRVEVKYCNSKMRKNSWVVSLKQIRHNLQQITIKKFNADLVELLAVYIHKIDQVFVMDASKYHGRATMTIKAEEDDLVKC